MLLQKADEINDIIDQFTCQDEERRPSREEFQKQPKPNDSNEEIPKLQANPMAKFKFDPSKFGQKQLRAEEDTDDIDNDIIN